MDGPLVLIVVWELVSVRVFAFPVSFAFHRTLP